MKLTKKLKRTETYRTAMHEATHAVIRIACDLPFEHVEVYDCPRDGAHGCLATDNRHLTNWVDVYAMAVSTAAPYWTEMHFCGDEEEATAHTWDDEQAVQEVAPILRVHVNEIYRKAKKLVEENWARIECVAVALMENRKLTYDEVCTLVEA